jgi:hypothetical protein
MLIGPHIAFVCLLALCPAATATAWYHVLSRHLVRSRPGAFIGGAFCGFAPGMVAHAQGHPNIIAQFLIPFIVWRTLRLREPGRVLRNGLVLGLLVTWQAFINEEVLLITALGCGLFLACYALLRFDEVRREAQPFLAGLGVTAVVAGALLAYPLWVQFFGPQHYRGLNAYVQSFGADLGSFFAFGRETLAGALLGPGRLAPNAAEENAFLGWPLVVLLALMVWWMRRSPVVLALTGAGLGLAGLSLGHTIMMRGRSTGIPGPFAPLRHLPLFNAVVPTRLALGLTPVVAILLALSYQRMTEAIKRAWPAVQQHSFALVWHGLLAATLLPLISTPLAAATGEPVPGFITDGVWRRYVPADRSLVSIPLPRGGYVEPMRWAAGQHLDFAVARGYFLGPAHDAAHPNDHTGIFGAPDRPTQKLLDQVWQGGDQVLVSPNDRQNARTDLAYWRAAVVVLAPQPHEEALWKITSDLLGFRPTWVDGVWVWDVRSLVP